MFLRLSKQYHLLDLVFTKIPTAWYLRSVLATKNANRPHEKLIFTTPFPANLTRFLLHKTSDNKTVQPSPASAAICTLSQPAGPADRSVFSDSTCHSDIPSVHLSHSLHSFVTLTALRLDTIPRTLCAFALRALISSSIHLLRHTNLPSQRTTR